MKYPVFEGFHILKTPGERAGVMVEERLDVAELCEDDMSLGKALYT